MNSKYWDFPEGEAVGKIGNIWIFARQRRQKHDLEYAETGPGAVRCKKDIGHQKLGLWRTLPSLSLVIFDDPVDRLRVNGLQK